jgi:PhoH-like ATPase
MPTKPATLLPVNEYPKAEPGKSPVRAVAAAPVEAEAVEDLISGKPYPAKSAARARAVPRRWPPSLPRAKRPGRPPETGPRGKLKEPDMEEPHPAKHKPVEMQRQVLDQPQGRPGRRTKVFVLDTNVLMHDPTSPVPLRGTRRLPADDDARRTRRPQEGHVRSGAQCAPGLAHARRPDRRHRRRRHRSGHRAGQAGQQGCEGPPVLPDPPAERSPAARRPAGRQGRQPDPGRGAQPGSRAAGRAIVLVSKDINMRIKARALGLPAEDYFNDHVLEDTDLLYSGIVQLPDDFWNKHGKDMESWQENKNGNSPPSTASPARPSRACW